LKLNHKYLWTFLSFVVFLFINHIYFSFEIRQDLWRRFYLYGSSQNCGNYILPFQKDNFVYVILQLTHISNVFFCKILSKFHSEIFFFYFLPVLYSTTIFILLSSVYKRLSQDPIPFFTILLIIISPIISVSIGEHIKSNLGLILFLLALLMNKKKKILFFFFAVLAHVTSLFLILTYLYLRESRPFFKLIYIILTLLIVLLSNYLILQYNDNFKQIDIQITLILIYGSMSLLTSLNNSLRINKDISIILYLLILSLSYESGRIITTVLPLVLIFLSIKNKFLWFFLIAGGGLSFLKKF
jgi:hypothetical protein